MRMSVGENMWYDPEVKNFLMLDVTDEIPVQHTQVIDGVELVPKEDFHVTLVAAGKIAASAAQADELIAKIARYVREHSHKVAFIGLDDVRYVCRDGDEMTLIAPARVSGVEKLLEIVREMIPDARPPFLHVTLAKNTASPYGIGVHSVEDLRKYCESVQCK